MLISFTSPLFFCAVKKSIAIFRVGEMAMHFGLFFLLYYFTSMPIMLYFLLSLMMRIWPFSYTFWAFD